MGIRLNSPDNATTQFGLRSFFLTLAVVTPLMALFAWFNMVLRMGLPISPQVFMGPIILGFIMSLVIAAINTFNFLKIHAIEELKLQELNDTQIEVILTLSEVAESRCGETGAHIKRVAEYSHLLALLAGLPENEAFLIQSAAPLHDIGKIATPDHILLKPGKLTPEEFVIMKEHAEIGYKILADSTKPILKTAATIAHSHHEKWDGTGYPLNLSGENIPIHGRIIALADVFDALGTERVYKKAWSSEQIRNYVTEQSEKHFDPRLAKLFLDNFEDFEKIRKKYD
jgi:response regulator RpfG family c-di-GMP phosphodiesterase